MKGKSRLPMGMEDFERVRREGFYYIDKTKMIKDLLEHMAYVNLFTRPRRFGKTLGKKNFVINIWENFLSFRLV